MTSQGIGNQKAGFHAVQKELAENWGSQCGMCSTGMVMSMYSLLQNSSTPNAEEVRSAGSRAEGARERRRAPRPQWPAFPGLAHRCPCHARLRLSLLSTATFAAARATDPS